MTELYELYKNDRPAAIEKIQSMDVSRLLAELDDTLQLDVMKKSHLEWNSMKELRLYRAIVTELANRCRS